MREDNYDNGATWTYHVDIATAYGSYLDDFWNTTNDWDEGQQIEVLCYCELPYGMKEEDLIESEDYYFMNMPDQLIKKVVGWRPIIEYDEANEFLHGTFDWVLVKMFDGNHACIPVVAVKHRDGKWYDQNNNELPFEVREFFDMRQLDKEYV